MTVRSMALSELRMAGFHGIGRPQGQSPGVSRPPGDRNTAQTNANIRGAGSAMASALGVLTGSGATTLEGRTSDADVATVQVDQSRLLAAVPPQDMSVVVQQTAQEQINRGDALTANMRTITTGEHNFEIESGGNTFSFSINVFEGDDNASIQRRMAAAINESNVGVTASIQGSTEDGATVSVLTLTGNQTGESHAFTVRDTDDGNLVAAMGVDTASQEVRNAVFTVNGGEARTSQSNEVNIAAGVNITLTGEGRADITFGRETSQMVSAARDLVSAVNSAIRGTNPEDGRGSARFLNDLIGMNITFRPSLERAGINVRNDGQLEINESRLLAAAEDGSLERLFEGGGFGARAGRIANNAAGTGQYANPLPPVNASNNNFDFSNSSNQWELFNTFS
ncbi:MAG: hypothetical protein FWF79_01590 [Defluviitaleaceae bacterium]|nr:hypothetical protein [Defluviitaleaceae bacterium]